MIVQTSRFGPVEVDQERVIQFSRGILGFPKYKAYVLIQPEADATFYWLQSVDAADLAFVVDRSAAVSCRTTRCRCGKRPRQELGPHGSVGGERAGDRQ